jgi:hypothetical protein
VGRFSDNLIGQNAVFSQAGASGTTGANECAFKSQNTTSGAIWSTRTNSSNNFVFEYYNGATWAEEMVLTNAGRLGIGESSPEGMLHISGSGSQQLTINGTGTANTLVRFRDDGAEV